LFDNSERAMRSAVAAIDHARELGLGLRAGIHTGEVELSPGDVRGLAVHLASRILALAGGGEVCVSGSTYELLAGSSFTFEDRGEQDLKGISGRRRVYSLVRG
jgi:class 3 adenylate cyclase